MPFTIFAYHVTRTLSMAAATLRLLMLLFLLLCDHAAQGSSGEERLPAVQDGQLRRLRTLQGAHRSRQPQEGKRRQRRRQRRRRGGQCCRRRQRVVVVVSQLGESVGCTIMYTTYTCIQHFQHTHNML